MADGWNFADVWEVIAHRLPDAPALRHGDRTVTWAEFDDRATGMAAALLDAGMAEQDKVAQYLYNCPEYLESVFAVWKAGLVPVNTNYRYTDHELVYLWDNADVAAVVFQGAFSETIARIRTSVPAVRLWLWVDDGTDTCPAWAAPLEPTGEDHPPVAPPWGRSGDQLYLLYTGGTTGMPKGVMWRQDDLFGLLNATAKVRFPPAGSLADVERMIDRPGPRFLTACPLMHGTGSLAAFAALSSGGSVITLVNHSFDVEELLDTITREGVQSLAIVGDVFAKPMVAALDRSPERWDLSTIRLLASSGVMWSAQTKEALLAHNPRMLLADSLGSSEAISIASSVTTGSERTSNTAQFKMTEHTKVIADDGHFVEPGSGEIGKVAMYGHTPLGYYKDEARSEATFRTIGGRRYAIPGDYAMVEPDGTLTLLGRGTGCINTGGEKVFPEEVEEVLKLHPDVRDAIVVGVPDDRYGEVVVGIIESDEVDHAGLVALVKSQLASYKAPKRIMTVPSLGRASNGKLDYTRWKAYAASEIDGVRRG